MIAAASMISCPFSFLICEFSRSRTCLSRKLIKRSNPRIKILLVICCGLFFRSNSSTSDSGIAHEKPDRLFRNRPLEEVERLYCFLFHKKLLSRIMFYTMPDHFFRILLRISIFGSSSARVALIHFKTTKRNNSSACKIGGSGTKGRKGLSVFEDTHWMRYFC